MYEGGVTTGVRQYEIELEVTPLQNWCGRCCNGGSDGNSRRRAGDIRVVLKLNSNAGRNAKVSVCVAMC